MEVSCDHCGILFKKMASEIKKSKTGANYCGSSCSAKANNRLFPKRQKSNRCQTCAKPIGPKIKFCSRGCNPKLSLIDGQTLGDYLSSALKKDANIYNRIRQRARLVALKELQKVCVKCGYSRHVEVCHKRPISDFPLDASIKDEINNIDNLIVLCPNCHWEYDHPELK